MAKQGDKQEEIRNNSGRLFGFIRKRVDNNEDAEDILQDVWYLFSGISLDDVENVSAWLYRVARNKITDWYRKRSRRKTEDLDEGDEDVLGILTEVASTAEEKIFQDMFWEELMDALDELPENQREVYMKSEIDGMKLQEIADETGESIKTISSRKQYAIRHLRKRLNNLYKEL